MTRRAVLAALAVKAVRGNTPRNEVAKAANEFHAIWAAWAEAWNRSVQTPDSVDVGECALFEEMEELWKGLRKKRTTWLKGVK